MYFLSNFSYEVAKCKDLQSPAPANFINSAFVLNFFRIEGLARNLSSKLNVIVIFYVNVFVFFFNFAHSTL